MALDNTKQQQVPASVLTLTYKQFNDSLHRASMRNDVHVEGDAIILTAYSNAYDERSGISIILTFRVLDTDTYDEDEASMLLIGAEREAHHHEWEKHSIKKVSVRSIKTLDDLLAMLEKQTKPKGKPKQQG